MQVHFQINTALSGLSFEIFHIQDLVGGWTQLWVNLQHFANDHA
jgi:hypothetical protein